MNLHSSQHCSQQASLTELVDVLNRGNRSELSQLQTTVQNAAGEFKERYKNPDGKDLREEFTLESGLSLDSLTKLGNELNTWTQQHQDVAVNVLKQAQNLIVSLNHNCLPGHDARHMVLMDGISALEILAHEPISDVHKLFVVPALLHDVGKFVEMRHAELGEKFHSELGFHLTRTLLREFELPEALEVVLADGVLAHARGESQNSLIAQFVQRADREQLIGPEMIYRSLVHSVGIKGRDYQGFLNAIDHYARNLYPQAGLHGEERASARKAVSEAFIWYAAPAEFRRDSFAPEIARSKGVQSESDRQPLNERTYELWKNELANYKRGADNPPVNIQDINQELRILVTPNGSTDPQTISMSTLDSAAEPSRSIWSNIEELAATLDSEDRKRFGIAIRYARTRQDEFERQAIDTLQSTLRAAIPDTLETEFAQFISGFNHNPAR